MYGVLHCSAGYAAARAGDRERANELLAEAATTAGRLTDDPTRQQTLTANVTSHRVSAAMSLWPVSSRRRGVTGSRLQAAPARVGARSATDVTALRSSLGLSAPRRFTRGTTR